MTPKIEIPRTAFPLAWPAGTARTRFRERATFGEVKRRPSSLNPGTTWKTKELLTVAAARDHVLAELSRLGAGEPVIISSNLRTRLDGIPAGGQIEPSDPGVAVYFMLKRVETCIAIDRYDRVADNLRAVAKSIDAMRGLERWGGASLVTAAFRGFQALPAPGQTCGPDDWRTIGAAPTMDPQEIVGRYRSALVRAHPDTGGSAEAFNSLREAWERIRATRPEVAAEERG